MQFRSCRAVLFDLDGTLADTAPDLVGTLIELRRRRGLADLKDIDKHALRAFATRGAVGLLEAGFGGVDGIEPSALRPEFIDYYAKNLWVNSRAFPGIDDVLERLSAAGLRLGIVTNKIEDLALPVVERAGWKEHFACIVGGDTVGRAKPDPAPVLEACRRLGVKPSQAVFLGDDRRDVLAGRAAGARTVVASWGYLPRGDYGNGWGADAVIDRADDLPALLGMADRASA
jgi:phosphoglycolate phosphatase